MTVSRAARPVGFVPAGRRSGVLDSGRDVGVVVKEFRVAFARDVIPVSCLGEDFKGVLAIAVTVGVISVSA